MTNPLRARFWYMRVRSLIARAHIASTVLAPNDLRQGSNPDTQQEDR